MKATLVQIAEKMKNEGLNESFISDAIKIASQFEGVYHLLEMWYGELDPLEKQEIIKDIQELIIDCNQPAQKRI